MCPHLQPQFCLRALCAHGRVRYPSEVPDHGFIGKREREVGDHLGEDDLCEPNYEDKGTDGIGGCSLTHFQLREREAAVGWYQ